MLFSYIPKYLFEQVKDRSFDIDRLFRFSDKLLANPTQLFYVLIDDEKKIMGIFWASANIICNRIDVNILSIDKEYQTLDGKEYTSSDAIKKTLEFIDTFQKDATVTITTSRTAAYEKAGFKKTKTVMQIENKEI